MKDEEMAGEYAGNISGLDISTTLMVTKNKTDAYRLGRYEGFLAGLKAGRPQWHDLRKDPTDLPGKDDYQIQITYVEYNHKWVTLGYYDQNTKKWFTSMELPLKKVIGWKKIIKLDEEVI